MRTPTRLMLITAALLATVAWFTRPATGQDRTDERLADLETRVAILESRVGEQPDVYPGQSTFAPAPSPTSTSLVIRGYVLVTAPRAVFALDFVSGAGGEAICIGRFGLADFAEGAAVTVRDESGRVVGASYLEAGTIAQGYDPLTCEWTFTVEVGSAEFYTFEVARHGEITFARAEIESRQGDVYITLYVPT